MYPDFIHDSVDIEVEIRECDNSDKSPYLNQVIGNTHLKSW